MVATAAPAGGSVATATVATAAVAAGELPDRDSVVEAWGDHILQSLPVRARALYSNGRFVEMAGGAATFALPNAPHRDRCQEVQPVVEQALAAHFGVAVPLQLVVDEGATGRVDVVEAAPAAGVATADAQPDAVWADDVDVDFDDPGEPADESVAQARLLEAFPGAEEETG
jgi:hypothetical protein